MRIVKIICIILAILVVLLLSFEATLNYYKPSEARTVNIIYNYLLIEPYTQLINVNFLDIKERRHLLDVKRWLIKINDTSIILSACFVICLLALKFLSKSFRFFTIFRNIGQWGMFVTVSVSLIFLTSFKSLFIYAHFPLFKSGTWVFSKDSLLTQLFPLSFFESFAFFTLGGATVVFILLIVSATLFKLGKS